MRLKEELRNKLNEPGAIFFIKKKKQKLIKLVNYV